MQFEKIPLNPRVAEFHRLSDRVVGRVVRGYDGLKATLHLGGRAAPYDDAAFEFLGGASDTLRGRHYDKSLRLLWKAEEHAPWLGFHDCSVTERKLWDMALKSMTDEEKGARERLSLPEYKALLNREYTPREKEAIVAILAAIGHGEAYAWLVSASLLGVVKSTGARAALTMQVLEEAKHFVVLRELLRAFDVPIRRQSAWEYLLLESVLKADGLEKFFGMNVLVEGIALSFFGMMSEMPGLEILRLFHLDEARHTALPVSYFKEFPLSWWQRRSPTARLGRLKMVIPALLLIPGLEEDLAELGIDAFDFGGSILRKVTTLADRSGFDLGIPPDDLCRILDVAFNAYCSATRPGEHTFRAFSRSETSTGESILAVERAIFAAA